MFFADCIDSVRSLFLSCVCFGDKAHRLYACLNSFSRRLFLSRIARSIQNFSLVYLVICSFGLPFDLCI